MASTAPRAAGPEPAVRLRDPAGRAERETARLYAEFGTKIYRHCLGQLRSHEDAEDAVQNTFLRVYTALRRGVVPEFEAPWLYKIAHNVCLSRRLGTTRRARVETPHDLNELEGRTAARQRVHDELFGLDDALAAMPPRLRRAILLREWQGLSYAEIAESLGTTQSAVETLIFRARRHLAQALERAVVKPVRRSASALNVGPLIGAAKALFGGASAVKLAAGAAVLAVAVVGGVEAERAIHRSFSDPATTPASPGPTVPGAGALGGAGSAQASPRSTRAGASAPAGSTRRSEAGPASPGGSGGDTPQSSAPGEPTAPASDNPGSTPLPPSSSPAPPLPTAPDPTLPDPTSSDPTLPEPTLPDATLPDPTLPEPTLPEPTVPPLPTDTSSPPLPTDTSSPPLPTVPTLP